MPRSLSATTEFVTHYRLGPTGTQLAVSRRDKDQVWSVETATCAWQAGGPSPQQHTSPPFLLLLLLSLSFSKSGVVSSLSPVALRAVGTLDDAESRV